MPHFKTFNAVALMAAALLLMGKSADADVISGPTLSNNDGGYNVSGISFTANVNSFLTSFTFQNQGLADIIGLYSATGTLLDSIATPSGAAHFVTSIDWSLTAGTEYYLLQTTENNGRWVSYGSALPADSQITLVSTGLFGQSTSGLPLLGNTYWADFNNITTTSAVPEPGTIGLFGAGLIGLSWLRRRKTV